MSKSTIVGLGLVVIVVIAGGVLYTTGDKTDVNNNNDVEGVATSSEKFAPDLIDAAHQYNEDDQMHIVAGETEVPTACHVLDSSVSVDNETKEAVIKFSARVEDEDQMCAQVITPQRFKVTFSAGAGTDIKSTFNGQSVELNLREVDSDEDLDEFEVYTKG